MLAKTQVASPLSRKAVLFSVSVSHWTGRKLDREVTDEVNRDHNATSDAGRYNKLIIRAERFKRVQAAVSAIRAFFYANTLPWADEGPRILPNMQFERVSNKMRELIREFEAAADEFEKNYQAAINERKVELNGLFKDGDYPSWKEIRNKFSVSTNVLPFPNAADFRSDLDPEIVEDIKREIGETTNKVVDDAMKHVAERIVETVGHMAKKLAEFRVGDDLKPGQKRSFFADSLVENVRELADLLPAFNLTNDPKLDEIAQRIKSELCVEEPKTLREDKSVRQSVQKSADQIVAEVSKFFS